MEDSEPEQLLRERNLFLELLLLQEHESPEELLPRALKLLVESVQARHGYIELSASDAGTDQRWHASEGLDDAQIENARDTWSTGIVAEALAAGRTIQTASAMQDPRFSEFDSVQVNEIQAVLCTPIGRRHTIGVIYLEGAVQTGAFNEHAEYLADLFGRCLSPICTRLVAQSTVHADDDQLLAVPGFIANSPSMRAVLTKLALTAPLEVALLFTGPSGSGKSLLARAVHANSGRASHQFIELNCATVPDSLFENELFGSAPGAHSAAPKTGSTGKVTAAQGGTLFLDEVGELSLQAQAKLLQLLQSGTYYRLGDSESRTADIRLIAASNEDLDAAVKTGRFREDLLYRLRVLEVALPSLAQRPLDTYPLAKHFLAEACERNGFRILELSPASITAIQLADWPGNARQLAHAVEAGAVNAVVEDAQFVQPEHIFGKRDEGSDQHQTATTLQAQLHAVRARIVSNALNESDWNISEAARRLDVARSYLYKLIRAHDLRRRNQD